MRCRRQGNDDLGADAVFLDKILNPDFQQRVKSDSHRSQQDRQADDLPPIQQSDDADCGDAQGFDAPFGRHQLRRALWRPDRRIGAAPSAGVTSAHSARNLP
jgi:hypothetical protein